MTRPSSALASAPRRSVLFAGLVAALAIGAFAPRSTNAGESAVKIAPPAVDATSAAAGTQTAVFAGGCFWGVQGVFQRVNGVVQALSGYAGGAKESAQYELVGSGLTGHAESVKITYDPKKVSYGTLLQIYFSVAHDPTQLNRQDPDSGPQYRSAVFYADAAQKETAEKYIAQLDAAKSYPRKIVTQVVPLVAFYPAEAYHQDYLTLHPDSGYIARFDLPKVANLKSMFPQQFRAEPALVMARAKSQ
ncbi:MAG TPA: peptide-methionine (S)-S-oxide reductase MsrA [Caldimonas sp.]|nr:peptide-methionine (S)-S-oxide reductase MsrA [Caldimonas sp.]HEV7577076.1 peptide-methionine (S)-S-oxide reductase MsrA [Caldimonas sp.]